MRPIVKTNLNVEQPHAIVRSIFLFFLVKETAAFQYVRSISFANVFPVPRKLPRTSEYFVNIY